MHVFSTFTVKALWQNRPMKWKQAPWGTIFNQVLNSAWEGHFMWEVSCPNSTKAFTILKEAVKSIVILTVTRITNFWSTSFRCPFSRCGRIQRPAIISHPKKNTWKISVSNLQKEYVSAHEKSRQAALFLTIYRTNLLFWKWNFRSMSACMKGRQYLYLRPKICQLRAFSMT